MDLTPIAIPGKRRRPSMPQNVRPVYVTISGKRTKRPLQKARQLPHMIARDVTRGLSPIERLPNEILQTIFSLCYNVNLPLASPFLARQLSSDRVYLDCATSILTCQGLGSDDCDCEALCVQATQLLQRRWFTWDVLKRVVGRAHELTVDRCTKTVPCTDVSLPAPDFAHPEDFASAAWYIHLRAETGIPPKLLHGPWSNSKAYFLNFLAWRNCRVDWEHSTDGELAVSGLLEAVSERNILAVATLLSPNIGVPSIQEVLEAAVLSNGCDRTIVFHLLAAALRSRKARLEENSSSASSVDVHSPALWRWAARPHENGTGEWLKTALSSISTMSSTRSRSVRDSEDQFRKGCGRLEDGVQQIPLPPF